MSTYYTVRLGDVDIFDPRLPELSVGSPVLSLDVNSGSLEITLFPSHPKYDEITRWSILTVYRNGNLLGEYVVQETAQDITKAKNVYAVDVRVYLQGSIIVPQTFDGNIEDIFTEILGIHNSQTKDFQQFNVGNITVDSAFSLVIKDTMTTWEALKRIQQECGGYFITRYENGTRYLDYVSEFSTVSTQNVEYGENLVSLLRTLSGKQTYTAIRPTGATVDGEVLTVRSVNDDSEIIVYDELANDIGVWFVPQAQSKWPEISNAADLYSVARSYLLDQAAMLSDTIEVNAIDLSTVGLATDGLYFGRKIRVKSELHGINKSYECTKQEIPLYSPASATLTLGETIRTLTDAELAHGNETINRVGEILSDYLTTGEAREIITEEVNNSTAIVQTATDIVMSAIEDYAKITDVDELRQQVSTTITQTANEIMINFNKYATLSDLQNLETFETELTRYIRIVNGEIILGDTENNIKLKLENDVLYFYSGADDQATPDTALAYFSDNKLFINNAQIVENITIGTVNTESNYEWYRVKYNGHEHLRLRVI